MLKLSDFSEIRTKDDIITSLSFINLLKSKWDEVHEKPDVFRYKIHNLPDKYVDDKYLLQLNPDRGVKRRIPEQIDNICQPFDTSKFNFTKVTSNEILFSLVDSGNDVVIHKFLVNVSPISRYHTLLCPSINKCLPQIVTQDSIKLAIDVMFVGSDKDLRIGFNSLCAFASVNHLHYHLLIEKSTLPVEKVDWQHIKGPLHRIHDSYPAPGFCFTAQRHSTKTASDDIYKLLEYFLEHSIAHNILITKRCKEEDDVSVIVWPRKHTFGVKQMIGFNVAVFELSGWIFLYDEECYERLKAEDIDKELSKWKVDDFDRLCERVKPLF